MITDTIIEGLSNGVIPWRKRYQTINGVSTPTNYATKKAYNGVNVLILGLSPYDKPYFMTFAQAKKFGGWVRKGEKALPIIYWNFQYYDGEGIKCNQENAVRKVGFAKYSRVFNVDQIEGIDYDFCEVESKFPDFKPIEAAQNIWDNCPNKPKLVHGSERACYFPLTDQVNMPIQVSFEEPEHYYSTLFHELSHSTGHASRLNREGITLPINRKTTRYRDEELVAEISSAYICAEAGISDKVIEDSIAYLQSWTAFLTDRPKAIFGAAKDAKKAAEYILGRSA